MTSRVPSSASRSKSGPRPEADVARAGGHPWAVPVGLIVAGALVVLDQATKEIAEALLTPGVFVEWIGSRVGWQLVYNPGGAFGIPAPSWVFLAVTVIVSIVVGRALPRTPSLVQASAYGLLLAGAVGNVVDRLVRSGPREGRGFGDGYVVDFVAWGSFPRFNLADSAITVGFVLLVALLWHEERRHRASADDSANAPEPSP